MPRVNTSKLDIGDCFLNPESLNASVKLKEYAMYIHGEQLLNGTMDDREQTLRIRRTQDNVTGLSTEVYIGNICNALQLFYRRLEDANELEQDTKSQKRRYDSGQGSVPNLV